MNKRVEWLSPERVIPGHGVATTGDPIELPADVADKFIKQGEAREFKPVAKAATRGTEEAAS